MQAEVPWSHEIEVAAIPPQGLSLELVADEPTRARLAKYAGVVAIPSLKAVLEIRATGDSGAEVTGTLSGVIRQTCVVSLEEFDSEILESIDARFSERAEAAEEDEIDEPDPVIDGKIDVGALAAEFLSLSIDPYPRKPGVAFANPSIEAGSAEAKSPFEALQALKNQLKK